jgi:hypothetical protein
LRFLLGLLFFVHGIVILAFFRFLVGYRSHDTVQKGLERISSGQRILTGIGIELEIGNDGGIARQFPMVIGQKRATQCAQRGLQLRGLQIGAQKFFTLLSFRQERHQALSGSFVLQERLNSRLRDNIFPLSSSQRILTGIGIELEIGNHGSVARQFSMVIGHERATWLATAGTSNWRAKTLCSFVLPATKRCRAPSSCMSDSMAVCVTMAGCVTISSNNGLGSAIDDCCCCAVHGPFQFRGGQLICSLASGGRFGLVGHAQIFQNATRQHHWLWRYQVPCRCYWRRPPVLTHRPLRPSIDSRT